MRYTVGELARLSGVSARTLRLYDEAGLLKPERNAENGYRLYGEKHVDRLQQILLYRELGVGLEQIGQMLDAPDFDRQAALREHYERLRGERKRLDALLGNVQRTLEEMNGGRAMKDTEKFEGFKREALEENERKYGGELRRAYGSEVVDASQRKMNSMTEKQWNHQNELGERINELLGQAMREKDPAGETARQMCEMHKQWLCAQWPDGMYTPEMHRAIGESYVSDERFTAYYDGACGEGAAKFLCDALTAYTSSAK